jgi:hypothetical protein
LAAHDLLGGEGDGAQAGAADLVDAESGLVVGQPGLAGRLAGGVLTLAGSTWPRITSSTSPGSSPARLIAADSAVVPRTWAGVAAKAPLKLPTGVRAAETMTTSSILASPGLRVETDRLARSISDRSARPDPMKAGHPAGLACAMTS